jgi:uncharacterized SAM-dependent methyltransferase
MADNELKNFIKDAREINPHIDSEFIYNAKRYFRDPSNKNRARLEPEFKRVMNIRSQKSIIKAKLFNSLYAICDMYKSEKKSPYMYCLDLPPIMYNLESQIKAYSEAVEFNKNYNKSIEDILFAKIIPSMISNMSHLPTIIGNIHIIALGCGSGIHEYEFVQELIKQAEVPEDKIRLYLTDINQSMVDEALAYAGNKNLLRIKEGKKQINTMGFQLDFLRNINNRNNNPLNDLIKDDIVKIFLFFGSTLGNFHNEDQKRIFQNISNALFPMDFISLSKFIVGAKGMLYKDGKPDKERMEQEYKLTENFAFKPFEILGIGRECLGDYEAFFNFNKYSRDNVVLEDNVPEIRCFFPVIKKTEIECDGQKIELPVGAKISTIRSQRFTKESLENLCSNLKKNQMGGTLRVQEILEEQGCIAGLYENMYLGNQGK